MSTIPDRDGAPAPAAEPSPRSSAWRLFNILGAGRARWLWVFALALAAFNIFGPRPFRFVVDVEAATDGVWDVRSGDPSDEESSEVAFARGPNKLTFVVPSLPQELRWHLGAASGPFTLRRLSLRTRWITTPLDWDAVQPGLGVVGMSIGTDGTLTVAATQSRDPQLTVRIPYVRIFVLRELVMLAFSLGIVLALLLCTRLESLAARAVEGVRALTATEGATLRSLPYLLAMAVSLNLLTLSTFAITIDDEHAAFRVDHSEWLRQGRWTVYLIERFLFPQPTIPYLPNLTFCVCVTLAYVLLVRAHGLAMTWRTYLLFPLFAAFPVWGYIAEFYANLPAASFGLLLTSLAALLFYRTVVRPLGAAAPEMKPRRVALGVAVQAALLALAIGAYQSYLFAFVSIGLGVIIVTTLIGEARALGARPVLWSVGLLALASLLGLGMYEAIEKSTLAALHTTEFYIDGFIDLGRLRDDPAAAFSYFGELLVGFYAGAPSVYGDTLYVCAALVTLGVLAILFCERLRGRRALKAALVALAAAALVSPLVLVVVAPALPYRSFVGIPCVVWFFGVLALSHRLHLPRLAGALALAMGTFELMRLMSLYAASADLTRTHDRMLAASIYDRIGMVNPDYNREQVHAVDFFGWKSFMLDLYPSVGGTTLNRTFFDWDQGNPERIVKYMRLVGYTELTWVGAEKRLELRPTYDRMPIWPAAGSVRVVDGITLVKLGPAPDPSHRLQGE